MIFYAKFYPVFFSNACRLAIYTARTQNKIWRSAVHSVSFTSTRLRSSKVKHILNYSGADM